MDDFEQFLKSQPMRCVPPEWRGDILAQAADASGGKPAAVVLPWWQAWLWPSPYAWGALAAAWIIIIGLNMASAQSSPNRANGKAVPSRQEFITMLDERRRLMEKIYSELNPPPVPSPSQAKLPDTPGVSLERRKLEERPFA